MLTIIIKYAKCVKLNKKKMMSLLLFIKYAKQQFNPCFIMFLSSKLFLLSKESVDKKKK